MALFPELEDALYFSMNDDDRGWSRRAYKPFTLDGEEWPSAEHYVQAMRFDDPNYRAQIRQAENPDIAIKLGKSWLKRKTKGWKQARVTMMSRALYTQFQVYPDMAEKLLATADQKLVENSQFNYFWGCGRDHRGDNHYGKILMNIRKKLKEK